MKTWVKQGKVCRQNRLQEADILIEDGKILDVGHFPSSLHADQTIDARGCYVLPGLIDFHVHLDDQIGDYSIADTYQSGSKVAIQNGITTIISFITQPIGRTLEEAVEKACGKAKNRCYCDYTWHLTPTTWDDKSWEQIIFYVKQGFKTLKLYTTYKPAGIYTSYDQMAIILKRVKPYGIRTLVHCEDEAVLQALSRESFPREQAISLTKWRPKSAEIEAITQVLALSKQLSAPVHIVHVSTVQGVKLIAQAKKEGVLVSSETGPQYLFFNEDYLMGEGGYRYLCTPPLRDEVNRHTLNLMATQGYFDIFVTDHCPFTKKDKAEHQDDVLAVPKGLPGLGALFHQIFQIYRYQGEEGFIEIAKKLSEQPAKLAGLFPQKGQIARGSDADLVICHLSKEERTVRATLADVYDPYVEFKTKLSINTVLLRGKTVVKNDRLEANASVPLGVRL